MAADTILGYFRTTKLMETTENHVSRMIKIIQKLNCVEDEHEEKEEEKW